MNLYSNINFYFKGVNLKQNAELVEFRVSLMLLLTKISFSGFESKNSSNLRLIRVKIQEIAQLN
jgi:hypothetical protein